MVFTGPVGHARPMRQLPLRRNITRRRVAGVAAGLSDFFGIDVTLIRVLFVLSIFFAGGAGIIIYLVGWVLMPQGPAHLTVPAAPAGRRWIAIAILALITAGFLARANDVVGRLPAIVVVGGLAVVVVALLRRRGSRKTRRDFDRARLAWQRRLDERAQQARRTTYLGGDPFQIGTFYPSPPPEAGDGSDNPSGFQTQ